MQRPTAYVTLLVLLAAGCAGLRTPPDDRPEAERLMAAAQAGVDAFVGACIERSCGLGLSRLADFDTLQLDLEARRLGLVFNDAFAHIPFREDPTAAIYAAARQHLGPAFDGFGVTIYALGQPIEALIPNYYRADASRYDRTRMPDTTAAAGPPLVRRADPLWQPAQGLAGRHIALWPSHGWYYEHSLGRWEWQRARVFQTVEDLLPMAFVVPYLVPMLENAGAYVLMPRERDLQTHEVIVDDDTEVTTNAYIEQSDGRENAWRPGQAPGFALGTPPYTGRENPFRQGGYRYVRASTTPTALVEWVPDIPAAGRYAVYIAYAASPDAVDDARYTVHHQGGSTTFAVNQQIGGGTWVYLGTFAFAAGSNAEQGKVVLTNESDRPGRRVTADAARFGGGMGTVSRGGHVSGRPRYAEAARYFMQYAGLPDSLVYNVSDSEEDDYRDDYQSRGEWVNYLRGAPYGPNKDRSAPGLGIPIDLSLAFHTDAGYARNDTTIGTLMIYNSDGADGTDRFPDGTSRFANRDFGDLLQTQIVDDLRAQYDPVWRRRSIWDRPYSEAHRPNVPSALLELLSHHNFLDMKFALDPRFRFDVSRSIYKAMLRFLATQHERPYTVQPLPVTHFQATFTGPGTVTLRWQPQPDPLEPTAEATHYLVYTRRADEAFDDGVLVDGPQATFRGLAAGVRYSYRVTAVNAGGESFPSEVLAVSYRPDDDAPVLVVNAFDRVAPPAALEAGPLLGFAGFVDQGVPDGYDLAYVGAQYEFDARMLWEDDDAPGHGASHADYEATLVAGNTFDFAAVHGASLQALGRAFVSASDEAVMAGQVALTDYAVVDLILGEEKETPWPKPMRPKMFKAFPEAMQTALVRYRAAGGHLFVSGAYVGSDLFEGKPETHPDVLFGQEILKISHRTDHAARTGVVASAAPHFFPADSLLTFNTALRPDRYAVESPDGIEPADSTAETIFRYAENNISAGVAYPGVARVVVLGFPFEAVLRQAERDALMAAVLRYFDAPASVLKTE